MSKSKTVRTEARKEYEKAWWMKNAERVIRARKSESPEKAAARREYHRQYRLANREKMCAANKAWRDAHPDYGKKRRYKITNDQRTLEACRVLKYKYGITADEAQIMLRAQNYLCALCQSSPATKIDHCHETGIVRGILCHRCNLGLGMFDDNINGVTKAMTYLTSFNSKTHAEKSSD